MKTYLATYSFSDNTDPRRLAEMEFEAMIRIRDEVMNKLQSGEGNWFELTTEKRTNEKHQPNETLIIHTLSMSSIPKELVLSLE